MQKLLIGRISPADIIPTGNKQETVSAEHALLEQTEDPGIWVLTDLGSSNGTFVLTGNGWERLQPRRKAKVNTVTRLRFGFLETTLAELFNRRTRVQTPPAPSPVPQNPARGGAGEYVRNPLTGEIQFVPRRGM